MSEQEVTLSEMAEAETVTAPAGIAGILPEDLDLQAAEAPALGIDVEDEEQLTDLLAKGGDEALLVFGSVEEMLEQEDYETLGRWRSYPGLPGSRFWIAHLSACQEKYERLQAAARAKKKIKPGDPLSTDPAELKRIEEGLFRLAMWKTVISKWEGVPTRDQQPFYFKIENFNRLLKSRRFRVWFFAEARDVEMHKVATQESIRGNS